MDYINHAPAARMGRLWAGSVVSPKQERIMKKKVFAFPALLAAVLLCGVTFAQEPVQDINPKVHPNLAAAQHHVVEANNAIATAQKDNKYDMKGHAEKARQLLVQVNNELKAAAEAANAAAMKKK
jgi:hypothetical protein